MPQGGEHQPAGDAGGTRMPIQPDQDAGFDVVVDGDDRQLDRLLGDADLLLRLQLSGYAPSDWDPLAAELARYGLAVCRGWLRRGLMFAKVREKTHYALVPPEGGFDDDAIETLATDTVVAALDAFLHRVLKRNKWDPTKGTQLKTYFVGQCCFQFANVYKGWYRAEGRRRRETRADHELQLQRLTAELPGVDAGLIADDQTVETLALLSTPLSRDIATLRAIGYDNDEIADTLGLADPRVVENAMDHQRRRLRDAQDHPDREEHAG